MRLNIRKVVTMLFVYFYGMFVFFFIVLGVIMFKLDDVENGTLKESTYRSYRKLVHPQPDRYKVSWKKDIESDVDTVIETENHSISYLSNGKLIKLDAEGTILFEKNLYHKGSDFFKPIDVTIDRENNLYVLGRTASSIETAHRIVKLDQHGNDQLVIIIDRGASNQSYNKLVVLENGNLVIGSSTSSNQQYITYLETKLIDESGTLLKRQQYNIEEHLPSRGYQVNSYTPLGNNRILVSGNTVATTGFILVIDPERGKIIDGSLDNRAISNAIKSNDETGDYLAVGSKSYYNYEKDYLAFYRFNSSGFLQQKEVNDLSNYFSNAYYQNIMQQKDGSVIAMGSIEVGNETDVVITKYDANYEKEYDYIIDTDLEGKLNSGLIANDGSIFITSISNAEGKANLIKLVQSNDTVSIVQYVPLVLVSIISLFILVIPAYVYNKLDKRRKKYLRKRKS